MKKRRPARIPPRRRETWGRGMGYGDAHVRQWAPPQEWRECPACRDRWTPHRTCPHCGTETVGRD